jgi:hypothetical protein
MMPTSPPRVQAAWDAPRHHRQQAKGDPQAARREVRRARARAVAGETIRAEAEAKNNPADLINIALEKLVEAGHALPTQVPQADTTPNGVAPNG